MEEGPEPQEMIERTVEHHHHGEHDHAASGERSHVLLPAIAAAVLAVLAALGSLLSGHAANQAILKQTKASDQWAYFQAKSTKGHQYEVGREIVAVLTEGRSSPPAARAEDALARFQKQVDRYNREKKEIQHEAAQLEQESRDEFHKHHHYALGIAAFQVGIVLASVSILVRYRALFVLSLLAGVIGIAFLIVGHLTSAERSPEGEASASLRPSSGPVAAACWSWHEGPSAALVGCGPGGSDPVAAPIGRPC